MFSHQKRIKEEWEERERKEQEESERKKKIEDEKKRKQVTSWITRITSYPTLNKSVLSIIVRAGRGIILFCFTHIKNGHKM